MGVLMVAKPTSQRRVEIRNDSLKALTPRPSRLRSHAILESLKALLAHPTLPGFEPIAQKVETFSRLPAVAEMCFVRMQHQAVVGDPRANGRQGGFRLLPVGAQRHKNVSSGRLRGASPFLPCLPSIRFCYPNRSRLAPPRYYAGSDP